MSATMERAPTEGAPVEAAEGERPLIADVKRFLAEQRDQQAKLISPGGEEIPLSTALYEVLRQAAGVLSQDEAVAIVPLHKLLTTNEAADLLNISRPSLIQVLERGELSYTKVGTHRRVRVGDLLAYMQEQAARRRAALDRLVEQSEECRLYDRT